MTNKLRFLVVDDDEIDRMQVRRSLKKAGFDVDLKEACNAEQALALVQTHQFDFGFLDYMLPDSDGLALLRLLREQGFKRPIVVLTGQGDEQVAVELMKSGASDYINKGTVDPRRLKQTINSALRIYRAESQAEQAEAQLRRNNELLKQTNATLRQQTKQIEAQNRQLIEAVRLKSEFIATVSHELRTPMNSIMGFSQVLERETHGQLGDRQQKMVRRIISNGQQLQTLINDLLDFSKIGAGGMRLKPRVFNLHQLMQETVEEFRPLAAKKQLDLTLDFQLDNPQLTNDPVRVRQILINLLSNAIKFTDEGSVQIWAASQVPQGLPDKSEAGPYAQSVPGEGTGSHPISASPELILGVADSGIGIAAEQQERIFDPFRQLDQSITRRRAGTGLGLAIVSSLVKLMGGQIELTSVVGEGSTFKVVIPRDLSPEGEVT